MFETFRAGAPTSSAGGAAVDKRLGGLQAGESDCALKPSFPRLALSFPVIWELSGALSSFPSRPERLALSLIVALDMYASFEQSLGHGTVLLLLRLQQRNVRRNNLRHVTST
uniref:Uncharacterized protein n=1 Tax=Chlamydomonas euryale TaxID=1486919 RepID=A0A7R9V755_9CHLO